MPDFAALTADIERMYRELLPVTSGQVAGYIPQLARVDPDQLAIAVCTVDGQRFAIGRAATAFCLQSVSKTVSYCLALDEYGTDGVHRHVGREPSGQSFNELALNPKGLPHNPGVSGALMLVIPGLMGICVWSPRLDEHGNSVRGIEFCRKLVAEYQVHVFDSLVTGRGRTAKRDPRRKKNQTRTEAVVALTWAASQGDLNEVRALIATGVEPGTADYDGRTPLHLAAAEGQLEVVRYLLAASADPQPADRWGGTPLSDAETNGHTQIAELLAQAARKKEVAV